MCCLIWQTVSTEDDFPAIKHDCLSIQHASPSIRHDCPSIRHDSPSIKHDGVSTKKSPGACHTEAALTWYHLLVTAWWPICYVWPLRTPLMKASYRFALLCCSQDSISGRIHPVEWFPADCCQACRDPHWQHQSSNRANTVELSCCLRGWCKCLSSNTRGWCCCFCCCKHLWFRCGHALLLQASSKSKTFCSNCWIRLWVVT